MLLILYFRQIEGLTLHFKSKAICKLVVWMYFIFVLFLWNKCSPLSQLVKSKGASRLFLQVKGHTSLLS